jgi:hypothetical protein
MPKYNDELKLKALGLISQDVPLREIQDKLEVTYPMLLKWRKEFEGLTTDQSITSLIEATPMLVRSVAKALADELNEVQDNAEHVWNPEFLDLSEPDVEDSAVEWEPVEQAPIVRDIDTSVGELVDGIDGYQKLSIKLQESAMLMTAKLNQLAEVTNGPVELGLLIESLTKLQLSFFSKNITNVNVLNTGGESGGNTFGGFKGRA